MGTAAAYDGIRTSKRRHLYHPCVRGQGTVHCTVPHFRINSKMGFWRYFSVMLPPAACAVDLIITTVRNIRSLLANYFYDILNKLSHNLLVCLFS